MYVKIDNKTSARYFQKETRAAKKACERYQVFPTKKKSVNMVVNDVKIFPNMKNKSQLSIENFLKNLEKRFAIIRSCITFLLVWCPKRSFFYHL